MTEPDPPDGHGHPAQAGSTPARHAGMAAGRTARFARSSTLETVLDEIGGAIDCARDDALHPPYGTPRQPPVMIVGAPRSGTTLMLQWLARQAAFAYPSNLAARFWRNPYFGARVQQALADHDSANMLGLNGGFDFKSDLGHSRGALAPSEFWYFWRTCFAFPESGPLPPHALAQADWPRFLEGLAGLEAAFDKPVALKAMIANWNIADISARLDKGLFINVERDPVSAALSLLSARERFFANRARWYSFRPAEAPALDRLSPPEQVAGQVFFTRLAVKAQLARLPQGRHVTVSYRDFCADPKALRQRIEAAFADQGAALSPGYDGPAAFDHRGHTGDAGDRAAITAMLDRLAAEHGSSSMLDESSP
ncbi:sulfotransferase [Yunchengibacter salinarum]|uniref:sulfotransferase n=1 Tax=Yunchengibacter salinarum TaxID=3133399 RepID=UPI0035B5AFFE